MQQQNFFARSGTDAEQARYCQKLHKLLTHCMQEIVTLDQQLKALPAYDPACQPLQERLNGLQERRRFYQTQLVNLTGFFNDKNLNY